MKPVLAALIAVVLCATLRVSAAQHASDAGALVSSWTLVALERVDPSGEPTRARSPHGLLILDGAGYAFEYFTAASGDASAARTDAQRAFAEHGGFWGRYEADAATGRIAFEAASGVSPNVHGLAFSRRYELDGDRLVVTSAGEPQAQRDTRWIWQRVPTVEHLTPAYREVLGFWEHVEERRIETATGEVLNVTRRAPSVIVYTPGGFVGVHFPRLDRAPFAADMPTAEEAEAALRGYIGYFGALSVYPGEVAHNVLGGLSPGPGSILRRAAAIDGDQLAVTLQNTNALITGEPAAQVVAVHLRRLSGAEDMLPRSATIVPAEQTAAARVDPSWRLPRFSWGDPSLEGTFTSRDMSGIPMVRDRRFGTREHLTPAELAERLAAPDNLAALAGNQSDDNRLQLSALDSAETGTRAFGYTSYIVDPADGQMPALTAEGQRRQEASRRSMNGPFSRTEDFSYYDRCISRGITGSIGPTLYGDAMQIVQSPTEVAIRYEMLHDTRVIPLDGRPPANAGVRQYMGSSVGRWEGDTLVVETTNFTDKLAVGRIAHSEDLKLTERFTRIDPEMIDYVVTVDDPRTFERPWTYRLTLTTQPGYEVLEYSCHEGNFFVANALRAEKVYQERVREARMRGAPIPARPGGGGRGRSIFAPPAAGEAVDINAAE